MGRAREQVPFRLKQKMVLGKDLLGKAQIIIDKKPAFHRWPRGEKGAGSGGGDAISDGYAIPTSQSDGRPFGGVWRGTAAQSVDLNVLEVLQFHRVAEK